jgi:hypothetical protein
VSKKGLKGSQLAPYCLRISQAIMYIIPQDLKQQFKEKYREILGEVTKYEQRV